MIDKCGHLTLAAADTSLRSVQAAASLSGGAARRRSRTVRFARNGAIMGASLAVTAATAEPSRWAAPS